MAGICPKRIDGRLRESVPAVCPLRPRGTALVASSPLRDVAPRCRSGSGYGQPVVQPLGSENPDLPHCRRFLIHFSVRFLPSTCLLAAAAP